MSYAGGRPAAIAQIFLEKKMALMREEDFDNQSYPVRKGQTRAFITEALAFVGKQESQVDNGRYDLLAGAMQSYRGRDFWSALVVLHPVMVSGLPIQESPFETMSPDRSVPLEAVWQSAQDELDALDNAQ
jgi:hypothetical protein